MVFVALLSFIIGIIHLIFQESRNCTTERLSWCVSRLQQIDKLLNNGQELASTNDDSIFVTPMYFVTWIDHTFDTLSKLAEVVYKTDYNDSDELYKQWKSDVSIFFKS